MKIAILGAGAWGTALALSASVRASNQVVLWARDGGQAQVMARDRHNAQYLAGHVFPSALQVAGGAGFLDTDLSSQELIVIASPMSGLAQLLDAVHKVTVPVVWLCKGFDPQRAGEPGLMGHEVQLQRAPAVLAGVLSGPSFAQEVALGKPTALVAASAHAGVRDTLVKAFHSASLRIYASDDVVGVEVGGAVKNVLAIATGLCDGLGLGANARAALVTRGLSEMVRLGQALGARTETFMGLSGLGDLVLTATGDLSRNRRVGLALAQGKTLDQALRDLGHVAEGVYCARTVLQRATSLGVDMPITRCVVQLLDGTLHSVQAVAALMGRDPKPEIDSA